VLYASPLCLWATKREDFMGSHGKKHPQAMKKYTDAVSASE
jgi:hypothetical protein